MMEKQGVINEANTPAEDQVKDAAACGCQGSCKNAAAQPVPLESHTTQRLADAAAKPIR